MTRILFVLLVLVTFYFLECVGYIYLGQCPYYLTENTNSATNMDTTHRCYIPACPGDTLVIGSCGAVSSTATCGGDQFLRLFDGEGNYANEVAGDDDGCGAGQMCSRIVYTVPAWTYCKNYYIHEGCFEGGKCGAVVEVYTTTIVVPSPRPTRAPTPRPTAIPTARPKLQSTPRPTAIPTARPELDSTPRPTADPTEQSTFMRTATPTEEPTEKPTADPTAQLTVSPSTAALGGDRASPTASPSAATVEVVVVVERNKNDRVLFVVTVVTSVVGTLAAVVALLYKCHKMHANRVYDVTPDAGLQMHSIAVAIP